MQEKNSYVLSREIMKQFRSFFERKIGYFTIYNKVDEPYISFNIMFEIYNYFIIELRYNNGNIGCRIVQGSSDITLDLIEDCHYDGNLEEFLKELDFLIKLRIPDKYLEYNGWK